MYNRYIPQADGTYLRSRVAEPMPPAPQKPAPAPEQHSTGSPSHEAKRRYHSPVRHPSGQNRFPPPQNNSVGSFLKNLLPQNFDTEDLIVVLLLLLISGNTAADQNTALMTLGIYLFL